MRVLMLNDYESAGGAEVILRQEAEGLRARGHDVRVFTIADVPGHRRILRRYIENTPARRALRAVLDEFEPDVIHAHNVYHELSPAVIAEAHEWRTSRPEPALLVMTAHDFHLICPNPGARSWHRREPMPLDPGTVIDLRDTIKRRWDPSLVRSAARSAQHLWNHVIADRRSMFDVILCPAGFVAAWFSAHGLNAQRLAYPLPPWSPRSKRDGPCRFVFAGRVAPEKGLVEFMDRLPSARAWTMRIAGDGPSVRACTRAIARHGLEDRVELLGSLSHESALAEIAAAHVAVVPSRWHEVAPLAVSEAVSLGTWPLMSNLAGMAEMAQEFGVGTTFDPFDPGSTTDAINDAIDRVEAGTLSVEPARPVFESRSIDAHLDQLEAIYRGDAS